MRGKQNLIPILIITIALLSILSWHRVQADSYMVTNTNDSGPGSLRQAITDAYAHPGADTITFDDTTNGIPIVLAGASGENANATGDLDILDGGDLTIQGNGAGNTIIDGGGMDRVIHLCPGGGCTNTVTINGVTIQNGTVSSGGGGIRNEAGTVIIDASYIRNNSAINGGGISNFATLIIQNGSVIGGTGTGNHSVVGNGGGIYNFAGTLTINNSTVCANSADNNGGGIWNQSTLNIQNDSTIGGSGVGNSAGNDGGGIHNYAGTTTVDGSTIIANSAGNNGGGISNDSTTTVDGSTISANSAIYGGGINNNGIMNIQNGSTIGGVGKGNTSLWGGGIYNQHGSIMTLDNSIVSANEASSDGGGIYNEGTLIIHHGSIIGGVGAGNTADYGGGIVNNSSTTIDGSIVSANSAIYGGGIFNFAVLNIQNGSTIGGVGAGNTASNSGGGIFNSGGTATVDGCRILNNTATSNGGGVYIMGTLSATSVTNSCIVDNSAMAFYNSATTQQTATGNWWGAPTGPNTPGADTVLGNVDVSGHLTSPILDCAPELQVSKSNDSDGISAVGVAFHWTLTITNTGLIDATFGVGQKILEDDLPTGPVYGTPVVSNFVDITNSANIFCNLVANKLTCQATGGNVTLGAVTGTFDVTISITPSAPVSLVNPAGICQIDPDGNIIENDESNNNCPANVVNVTPYTARQYLPLTIR